MVVAGISRGNIGQASRIPIGSAKKESPRKMTRGFPGKSTDPTSGYVSTSGGR